MVLLYKIIRAVKALRYALVACFIVYRRNEYDLDALQTFIFLDQLREFEAEYVRQCDIHDHHFGVGVLHNGDRLDAVLCIQGKEFLLPEQLPHHFPHGTRGMRYQHLPSFRNNRQFLFRSFRNWNCLLLHEEYLSALRTSQFQAVAGYSVIVHFIGYCALGAAYDHGTVTP